MTILGIATAVWVFGFDRKTEQPAEPSHPVIWRNPLYPHDFPDPEMIQVGDRYIAFATNGPLGQIQAIESTDLGEWTPIGDVLSQRPSWASAEFGRAWAPSVAEFDNSWLLYASFPDRESGKQCIGVFSSAAPGGPYESVDDLPLVRPAAAGGAIDPSVYRQGVDSWLLWTLDGNCCGLATTIQIQRDSRDGIQLVGSPTSLLDMDQVWEENHLNARQSLIEAPELVQFEDSLVLLYSANGWDSANYALGYAICDGVDGPCELSP